MAKNCALYVSKNCAVLLAEKCVLYLTIYKYYVDAPAINKDTVQQYIDMYTQSGEITSDGTLAS